MGLTNREKLEIITKAKAEGYSGNYLELFQNAPAPESEQERKEGLRPAHAAGNTNASMSFPNVGPNQPFNTVGMKAPIDIRKYDDQGNLIHANNNVPPGVKSVSTGPGTGTVVETPAKAKHGGMHKFMSEEYECKSCGGYKKYQEGDFQNGVDLNPAIENVGNIYSSPEYRNRLSREHQLAHGTELSNEELDAIVAENMQNINRGGATASGTLNHPDAPKDALGYAVRETGEIAINTNDPSMGNPYVNARPGAGVSADWQPKSVEQSVAEHEVAHRANAAPGNLMGSARPGDYGYYSKDEAEASMYGQKSNYYNTYFDNVNQEGEYESSKIKDPNNPLHRDNMANDPEFYKYARSPEEIKSQKKQMELAMQDAGIWDPTQGPFTQEHVDALEKSRYQPEVGLSYIADALNIPTITGSALTLSDQTTDVYSGDYGDPNKTAKDYAGEKSYNKRQMINLKKDLNRELVDGTGGAVKAGYASVLIIDQYLPKLGQGRSAEGYAGSAEYNKKNQQLIDAGLSGANSGLAQEEAFNSIPPKEQEALRYIANKKELSTLEDLRMLKLAQHGMSSIDRYYVKMGREQGKEFGIKNREEIRTNQDLLKQEQDQYHKDRKDIDKNLIDFMNNVAMEDPFESEQQVARYGGLNRYQDGAFQFNDNYRESTQRVVPKDGVRQNPDGSHSTHLMADNNKDTAWPTLFQDKAGNWFEPVDAYQEAKRRGELYKFDSTKELFDFARKGNWKKHQDGNF